VPSSWISWCCWCFSWCVLWLCGRECRSPRREAPALGCAIPCPLSRCPSVMQGHWMCSLWCRISMMWRFPDVRSWTNCVGRIQELRSRWKRLRVFCRQAPKLCPKTSIFAKFSFWLFLFSSLISPHSMTRFPSFYHHIKALHHLYYIMYSLEI
jgi:hypothetical protein